MVPARRLLLCLCLLGAARAPMAEPSPEAEPREQGIAAEEAAAGAIFSPFAAVASTREPPAAQPPQPAGGDLALPLAAALAGTVGIGLLIARFVA